MMTSVDGRRLAPLVDILRAIEAAPIRGAESLDRLSRLSARELSVLASLGSGRTSKAVAHELGISLKTVEIHRARIMEKLDCSSPVELGRLWESAISAATIKPDGDNLV